MIDRFWSKVDQDGPFLLGVDTPCWIWTANRTYAGYGILKAGWYRGSGKSMMAHRLAYELTVGSVPEGLVLDHLCKNPSCVNPVHLDPTTSRVNVVVRGLPNPAKENAGKKFCVKGHPLDGDNLEIVFRGRKAPSRRCKKCNLDCQKKLRQNPEMKRHHALYERERRRRLKEVR